MRSQRITLVAAVLSAIGLGTLNVTIVHAADAPATKPSTQPVDPAAQAEAIFKSGSDALYQGDYTRAVDLLSKAASLDKSKSSYRMHLARAYRYAGKPKEAEALLEEVLKQTPDHVEAGQVLAEIYARAENWKQVSETLEPLLKYRHDYTTYHLLAEAKFNLGDTESARSNFEEALKLNPNSASDHYQLANIYLSGNFFALAANAYQRALASGMHSPVLHYKLASAYFNLRNYFGQTQEVMIKSGKPESIHQEWFLIEPVAGKKDYWRAAPSASAVYQVAKAVAEGLEERTDIRFLMANIYLNAGRYQRAHEMFAQLEKAIPKEDKALFHYYYGQAAFGLGKYDDYLARLQEAIKLDAGAYQSTLVDAYLKVAEQYNQAGDLEKHIEYLIKAVGQSPQTASLHLSLGSAYEEAQKYEQAVTQWKMVLDLEPEHPRRIELTNLIGKYAGMKAEQPATKPAGKI
ncbi:tetratricopeptide repeat protein [Humisphaera borealis]|uniref:Tetratricopeptide repeat protein n=1 Tax=Humisphaera borealis TaxID=2807512 RepID=A0A7M2X2X1_9BACT|nr:tetratricopeptide repeat protein [Humisphaera borealis]QOV91110.1 tetratricopeptide repeat protein [Humisphaera borealis]